MKSLFIVNDFPPILGGQSRYYYNVCKAIPGDKLILLAPEVNEQDAKIDEGLPFPVYRKPYLVKIPIFEKFIKIILPLTYSLPVIMNENIGMVHCAHILSTGIVGLILKKVFRKPFVVYTHSADILEYEKYLPLKYLLHIILFEAQHVVCNSYFTKSILERYNVSNDKITVSLPKIDVDQFSHQYDTTSFIEKYNLQDKKILLSVNRLVERKGNDTVINALPNIIKEIPNLIYIIAGDGPCRSSLENHVKKNGLDEHVIFIPETTTTELITLYQLCDVFIMASREIKETGDVEGFGIVFLEANACGKPVIGGDSGGVGEAVLHEETGLLVDPNNINEISTAISRLLTDKTLAQKLGQHGKQRVIDHFQWTKNQEELKHLFP